MLYPTLNPSASSVHSQLYHHNFSLSAIRPTPTLAASDTEINSTRNIANIPNAKIEPHSSAVHRYNLNVCFGSLLPLFTYSNLSTCQLLTGLCSEETSFLYASYFHALSLQPKYCPQHDTATSSVGFCSYSHAAEGRMTASSLPPSTWGHPF